MKLAKGRVDMYRYKDFSFDGSAEPSLSPPFENIIKVVNYRYHCLPVLNLNQHFSLNFSMYLACFKDLKLIHLNKFN